MPAAQKTTKNKTFKHYHRVNDRWVFNISALDAWHLSPSRKVLTIFMDSGHVIKVKNEEEIMIFLTDIERHMTKEGYHLVGEY